jgi:hypothetical protein
MNLNMAKTSKSQRVNEAVSEACLHLSRLVCLPAAVKINALVKDTLDF